jgi:hypothetical protein
MGLLDCRPPPVGGSSAVLRRLHRKPLGLLQCPAVTHDDNVAVKILSGLTTAWIFAASDSCWTYSLASELLVWV